MLFWLLAGTLITAFPVLTSQAAGNTIYIRADGSIDPPSAPIQRVDEVYTLTSNINESIVIERDDIVIDGAGYILQGESAAGLSLSQRNNVTVKNFRIMGFLVGIDLEHSNNSIISYNTLTGNGYYGIWLQYSKNNTILDNTAINNDYGLLLQNSSSNALSNNIASNNEHFGIYLENSTDNTIFRNTAQRNENGFIAYCSKHNEFADNTAADNVMYGIKLDHSEETELHHNTARNNSNCGICLDSSGNCTLSGNVMSSNKYNFGVEGTSTSDFEDNIEWPTNVADGKPIYYMRNGENMVIDSSAGVSAVYIINSINVTIKDLSLSKNVHGVFLWNTNNSRIENVVTINNCYGIALHNCFAGQEIFEYYPENPGCFGVFKSSTINNSYGIYMSNCGNHIIAENIAENNTVDGIRLFSSDSNLVVDNSATSNTDGFAIDSCRSNWIAAWRQDSISIAANNTRCGFYIVNSNDNRICWNTAINNKNNGFQLSASGNNEVLGNNATNNYGGIRLDDSRNNTISENIALNNNGFAGIFLYSCPNSTVTDNKAINNSIGIGLGNCEDSVVFRNIMTGNKYNFRVSSGGWPPTSSGFDIAVDLTNLADGKPIYFINGVSNIVFNSSSNAATIYVINSTNITIRDLNLSNNDYGVYFWNTNNSKIEDVIATNSYWSGVGLEYSYNITISDCTLTNTIWHGISLRYCDNNAISGNIITRNNIYGVLLYQCSNNVLSGNIVTDNAHGQSPSAGIYLLGSNNTLFDNTLENNEIHGIFLSSGSNNKLFHNNIINNQAVDYYGSNVWDNGAEGNYWSDYAGQDLNGDGVGDEPYMVSEFSQDHYPLAELWSQTRVFIVSSATKTFDVYTASNSTIAGLTFNQAFKQIGFKTTGPEGTTGFCNVTIPKELLDAPLNLWKIEVDGKMIDFVATENTTHTFIYFAFTHSTKTISVEGTNPIDNTAPTANAGLNQTVDEDTIVTFDGSASTDNVYIANYIWTFYDETPQTLTGVTPTYNFTTPGTYPITLNITDLRGNWGTDTCKITVLDKTPPVSDAGLGQIVKEGTLVTFDASGSYDNVALTDYLWIFIDVTPQTLKGKNVAYSFQTPGNYTVTLNVTDVAGNWASDAITITVLATPMWSKWWFWPMILLIGITSVSFPFGMKYYRSFKKQKEILMEYESELEELPTDHLDRARARFIRDLIRRKEKIDTFSGKYGIKLRPGPTLEDVGKKLGIEIKQ